VADALHTPGATSAADARLADAGLIAAHGAGMAVRTGVLYGPGATGLVTGTAATAPMTVQVAAHHWVTTRGPADGVYRGAAEAVRTVNIAAAPAANSRIDVVYVKQNDTASTISPDGTTGDVYAVAQGTAAATPAKPAIPVGAEELATITVAAGATATNGAGVTITNTARLTTGRGAPVPVRNAAERDALTSYPGLKVFRIDLGYEELYASTTTGWLPIGARRATPVLYTDIGVGGTTAPPGPVTMHPTRTIDPTVLGTGAGALLHIDAQVLLDPGAGVSPTTLLQWDLALVSPAQSATTLAIDSATWQTRQTLRVSHDMVLAAGSAPVSFSTALRGGAGGGVTSYGDPTNNRIRYTLTPIA
jgi:hypothetical protein